MPQETEYVWLVEKNQLAAVISRSAHYAVVAYTDKGIDYEVVVTNDEYDNWEGDDIDGRAD